MTLANVRVPADSNGKRIKHDTVLEVTFSGGVLPFTPGEFVTFSTSGVTGYIIKVEGTLSDGTITLQLDEDSPQTCINGENIVADGGFHGTAVGTGTAYYIGSAVISGRNNGLNGAYVSNAGSLQVGYLYGDPYVTSFGELKVAETKRLGTYKHTHDDQSRHFYTEVSGGGSVTWNTTSSYMLYSVGTTAGAKAIRTSHRRHNYSPGNSNKAIFTIAVGDSGKANNIREWGWGDDENGLFFQLRGTTFGVCIRSTAVDGNVTETFISQSQFNVDQVDGTGISKYTLDVASRNLYWIDYAWLGVGVVRFGVVGQGGVGQLVHVQNHNNGPSYPFLEDGTMPVRIANYNSGGIPSSTCELRSICIDAHSETEQQNIYEHFCDIFNTGSRTITTATPILSARSKMEYHGAKHNHITAYPDTLSVFVSGGNVKLDIAISGTLTGATWNITGSGSLDGDQEATAISNPFVVMTRYVSAGTTNIDLKEVFHTMGEAIRVQADHMSANIFSVIATKLDGTTVTGIATLNYKEL